MSFADPYLLALLALVPALVIATRFFNRDAISGTYSNVGLLAGYKPTWRSRYRWLPTLVRAVALGLLVIAIARPQIGQADSLLQGEGIDLVIVTDTSSSMSAPFGGDSRLVASQKVITDFISNRQDDRLGLVIFREQPLVLSPLTLDYEALKQLVDGVDESNLPDGTGIGVGLAEGLSLLRESKARSRAVILLTDGDNNVSTIEPLAAAQIAKTLGVHVYTVGLIDPAGRRTGGVNVDEKALQEMANLTGGRYFAAENEVGLQLIYDSIDTLEKSDVGKPQYAAYNELAVYFLAASLLLLALELGLRSTLWREAT